jgi:hypothetical protein
MKIDGNLLQGYNCRAAIDGRQQPTTGSRAPGAHAGAHHGPHHPGAQDVQCRSRRILRRPSRREAVAGYWSVENAKVCEERGVDPLITTGRQPNRQPPPPIHGQITMPKNSLAAYLHHRFGPELGFFAEAGAQATRKYDCFRFVIDLGKTKLIYVVPT